MSKDLGPTQRKVLKLMQGTNTYSTYWLTMCSDGMTYSQVASALARLRVRGLVCPVNTPRRGHTTLWRLA